MRGMLWTSTMRRERIRSETDTNCAGAKAVEPALGNEQGVSAAGVSWALTTRSNWVFQIK
jgi:hypothetical protein